jgi:hypothetical protein
MTLHSNGTVSEERGDVISSGDGVTTEWRFVDEHHWQLRRTVPPSPDIEGLEEGAIEVTDYEVLDFSRDKMTIEAFDEETVIYERAKS